MSALKDVHQKHSKMNKTIFAESYALLLNFMIQEILINVYLVVIILKIVLNVKRLMVKLDHKSNALLAMVF